MLNMIAPVDAQMNQVRSLAHNSLQDAFGAAQSNISAQFSPVMRQEQARLGASPLLADSGYANRLNRQIQSAAFGDLSRSYGNAAAQSSQSQLEALQRLLAARNSAASGLYGSITKRKNFGQQLAGFGGQLLGGIGGSFLSGYGAEKGKQAA